MNASSDPIPQCKYAPGLAIARPGRHFAGMTDANNPLLADTELPPFSAIRADQVNPAIDAVLAEFRAEVVRLTAAGSAPTPTFANLIAPLERLEEKLGRVFAPVSHLHSVQDTPELREAYSRALEKLTEHGTELGQNRELYAATERVRAAPEFARLSRAQQTLVEDSLRDFRLSGVALEEPARTRFKQIQNQISKLETEFEEAVLDATDAWTRPVTEAELAGLPDSARTILAQAAQEKQQPGFLATLKGPAVQAVLTFADDRALRETVYTAYNTRASDQGPGDHSHDNSARIGEILALRHEAAQLLGYPSKAHLSLADKMAGTPERVLAFLHELVARAKPVAQRELAELRRFAADELGIADLQPWDVAYASEKLRTRLFDFSEEDLKPYFPLPAVMNGLFALTERIFGVRLVERRDVDVWHPDVRYFDVVDADGSVRAGAYLDNYARSGKRGGAWMDVCHARLDDGETRRRPIAFLTCNFAPPGDGKPSLLTHEDVLTLFHEFGHGLHHMLTRIGYPSIAGINGVAWDAVELPSQFMENYAWLPEVLARIGAHAVSGESIPEEKRRQLIATRSFHAGLQTLRQVEFALFDIRLHAEYDPARGANVYPLLAEVRGEVAVTRIPEWNRYPHSFAHIFAGGYAAGYYSYKWAEVLAADAFAAFRGPGAFDKATARRFLDSILARGGSRDALEAFIEFRGRKPEIGPLLELHGIAPPKAA